MIIKLIRHHTSENFIHFVNLEESGDTGSDATAQKKLPQKWWLRDGGIDEHPQSEDYKKCLRKWGSVSAPTTSLEQHTKTGKARPRDTTVKWHK